MRNVYSQFGSCRRALAHQAEPVVVALSVAGLTGAALTTLSLLVSGIRSHRAG